MSAKTELVLVPVSTHTGELRVLVRRDSTTEKQVLPHQLLKTDVLQKSALEYILRDLFAPVDADELSSWISSPKCKDRVVDVYDRDLLFEGSQSVAIVRVVAVPSELAPDARGIWLTPEELFAEHSHLSHDCRLFVRDALALVPFWIRHSSLAFELLPKVFSIQDLRLLVGLLSGQEIDPGNFHRRLKRLDVLNPLVAGQRVHRWEFAWVKGEVLKGEGLIP
ncbi:MAG: NrtR DNA-binding winged helix domain-containing protein [Silvanigrellaceae bacterium]